MKKKLLFFGYTLNVGGAEKVMVDLINILKKDYDIDVALLKAQGEFLNSLPNDITIIEMRKGLLSYILFRYVPFFRKHKINKIVSKKNYDSAIGFIEGRSATWVADINKDIHKVAWVHTDVSRFDLGISKKETVNSYSKMDKVVFVSEIAKANFVNKFGIDSNKAEVLHNLINEEQILKLSDESVPSNTEFTFVNVGRLSTPKRQDRLIRVAKLLKNDGLDFKIQIIGNGTEEENLRKLITDCDVADCVELLGLKTNPYPYVKQADCFVLSSDVEGYCIAVKESLLLATPVISTNVSGIKEELNDGDYGIICKADTHSMYEAMRSVLLDNNILNGFRKNLITYDSANDKIINKLYTVIERN